MDSVMKDLQVLCGSFALDALMQGLAAGKVLEDQKGGAAALDIAKDNAEFVEMMKRIAWARAWANAEKAGFFDSRTRKRESPAFRAMFEGLGVGLAPEYHLKLSPQTVDYFSFLVRGVTYRAHRLTIGHAVLSLTGRLCRFVPSALNARYGEC
jgi:hypothetical protein